jgi:hypothetical protein
VVGETASLNLPTTNALLLTNVITVTNVPPQGGEPVVTNLVVTNYYGGDSSGGPGADEGNPLGTEAMVAAFSSDGQVLEYCTYLGGNAIDAAIDVAQDTDGNLLIYGLTQSEDFPVITNAWVRIAYTNVCVTNYIEELDEYVLSCTRAFTNTWPIPDGWEAVWKTNVSGEPYWGYYDLDVFLTKLSADGDEILYSLYQGTEGNDQGMRVAVEAQGRIYMASLSEEYQDPLLVCMEGDDLVYWRPNSVFVPYPLALVPTADRGLWIGGELTGEDLAISDIFASWTTNTDGTTNLLWRIRPPFQDASGGGKDGFLTLLDQEGNLVYASFLGGTNEDSISGLALNEDGGVTVAGNTVSTNFPIMSALFPTNAGSRDLFVSRLDDTLTNLVFSTYVGGGAEDYLERLAVDAGGDLLLAGWTLSTNFPQAAPLPSTLGETKEGLVASVTADGSALRYATLVGGNGNEEIHDVAVDTESYLWVAGSSQGGLEAVYGSVVLTNWWNVTLNSNDVPPAVERRQPAGMLARLYPGEAALEVARDPVGAVEIRWPVVLPDYLLQSTAFLFDETNEWVDVTSATLVGTNWIYTVSELNGEEYFRLERRVTPEP